MDPGVILSGAVQRAQVLAEPLCASAPGAAPARQPLLLTLLVPGLYQLYVHDVALVPEGADAAMGVGRGGAPGGRTPSSVPQPQKVYASVDRLNVLCTC